LKITSDHTRRSKPKPPETAEAKSNLGRKVSAVVIIAILVASLMLLQSGILSPSGSTSSDATAALQTFNLWADAINAHNDQTAIGYTTLHFLDPTVNNNDLMNYFVYIFSNQSLVFSTADIKAVDAASMSQMQKNRSEQSISDITNQNNETHIDEIVIGYVMITGSMVLTGMPDLPEMGDLVMVKIGGGWYVVLGS